MIGDIMDYGNKHILVLGAGESGIGAARVLAKLGAHVILNDYKPITFESALEADLEKVGITIITGRQDNDLLEDIDRIIISPGIAPSIPIVKAAKAKGIEVVGEVELAYNVSKAPILGVTGTNGKTTTTTLLAAVMRESGKPILVGGNIGDSLSEAAYRVPAEGYLIAELSSYQLETVKDFHPHGAIVLNVTPDHLARHKTMEAYAEAKEHIFLHENAQDFVVLNRDDSIVAAMKHRAPGQVLEISQVQVVDNGAYYADGICYAVKNGQAQAIISNQDIHIPGSHNIENILTVIALTYALGLSKEAIFKAISQFTGVEHRLEKVTTIDGVVYYNDSKATNVDSVVKALEAFSKKVILLAGGYDKMTELEDFMKLVKERTKHLILMGNAADRFEEAAQKAGVANIHRADSMKAAVVLGQQLAQPGDIVLLSPACSSFDWYSCFEERGEDFKKEVLALQQ